MIAVVQEKPPHAVVVQAALVVLALPFVIIHPPTIPLICCIFAAFLCCQYSKALDFARTLWSALRTIRKSNDPAVADDAIMNSTARYKIFKKNFSAAKLIGTHGDLLKKYLQRYSRRPDVAKLAQRAYDEICKD